MIADSRREFAGIFITTMIKFLIWAIIALDASFGFWWILNALNILQSSKYSNYANTIFATLFCGVAIAGVYFLEIKKNNSLSFLIVSAPWTIGFLILMASLIFGNYK